jgi:hypothetical protein
MEKQRLTFNKINQAYFIKRLRECTCAHDLEQLKFIAQPDAAGRPKTQAVLTYLFSEAGKIIGTDPKYMKCVDFPTLISNKMQTTFIPQS